MLNVKQGSCEYQLLKSFERDRTPPRLGVTVYMPARICAPVRLVIGRLSVKGGPF